MTRRRKEKQGEAKMTTTMTMEMLRQIRQTLSKIDGRVPDALRVGLDFGNRVSPAPGPGEHDDLAEFAASLLQPLAPTTEDDNDDDGHDPKPSDAAAPAAPTTEEDNDDDGHDPKRSDAAAPAAPTTEDNNDDNGHDPKRSDAAAPAAPTTEDDNDDDGHDPKPSDAAAPAAPPALRLNWASCYLPLHDHDAHFGNADAGVLAVADGVGSYMEDGIDASAFSRGLMRNAAAEVAGMQPGARPVCPYELLKRAYEKTAASRAPGASTAVIVSLDGDALKWACIGDSSFAVVRDGRVVFLSEPQQDLSKKSKKKLCNFRHEKKSRGSPGAQWKLVFSFDDPPFQLKAKGGNRVADAKTSADTKRGRAAVPVRAGDVVVLGTDGLFNNLLLEHLEGVVRMGSKPRLDFSPKNMADIIAGVAYERSKEELKRKECRGKPDDITVVVAFVV